MASKDGARQFAAGTFTGLRLDPKTVVIEKGFNARDFSTDENKAHVRSLADSIKEIGVQVPLRVRLVGEAFHVVDGESRLRATLLAISEGAPIETVPAVAEPKGVDDANRTAMLLVANSGKRLTPLEQALVIGRLTSFGWTADQISASTGVSRGHISALTTLHSAPAAVKAAVREGKVSSTTVIDLARDHGDDAGRVLADMIARAAEAGRDKATPRDAVEPKKRHRAKRAPLSFSPLEAKALLYALFDLHVNAREYSPQKIQAVVRNTLESLVGQDWKKVVGEAYEAAHGK